jgi:hypothetical protein
MKLSPLESFLFTQVPDYISDVHAFRRRNASVSKLGQRRDRNRITRNFQLHFLVLLGIIFGGIVTASAQSIYEPYYFDAFAGVAPGSSDGTGSAARFDHPESVAADSAGNVYVADTENNTIRKITPAGAVSTFAGSAGNSGSADGSGGAARFDQPGGVAVDSAGNVYVADTANHTIRKITPAGVVTTLAGSPGVQGSSDGTGSAATFSYPSGVAVDSTGNIYVADTDNDTIRKITPAGVVTTLAGSAGNVGSNDGTGSAAQFNGPHGVSVNSAGVVYVTDTYNFTIREITAAGVVSTLAGSPGVEGWADGTGSDAEFDYPWGITVGSDGTLYVAEDSNMMIRKITPAGDVSTWAGFFQGSSDGTGTAAQFNQPHGVTVDSAGNVYVSDTYNSTLRKITPSAVVTTLAGLASPGSTDGTGSAARFWSPRGVAMDSMGNIYVADTFNDIIRKITPAGVVSTVAGLARFSGSADGTGSGARFFFPWSVTVDTTGNVYVADTLNHTIRKITPAGVVTTLAGSAGSSGSADGTGAAARFNNPEGVAVDGAGNVYVADDLNHTIRKITSAGVVTTLAGLAGSSGSADGAGNAARFFFPTSVTVDNAGNIYVADSFNATIRKVTAAGAVTTLAGLAGDVGSADGTGSAARFFFPTSVAVDSAGNVYVTDTANDTIRKITPAAAVTTLGGLPGNSGSTNGAGNLARFDSPEGVAVDSTGKLYVADANNNTIRVGVPLVVAVSRKNQGGTNYDIALPLTGSPGIDCRSGGGGNVYQIVVTFANPVTFDSVMVTSGNGSVTGASGSGTATATIDLSGVTNQQTINVTVFGLHEGSGTRDLVIPMGILIGDVNGSRRTDSGDVTAVRNHTVSVPSEQTFRYDVNASGRIDSGDVTATRNATVTVLP